MMRVLYCLIISGLLSLASTAAPLQTFTIKNYLRHQWTDEIVHFPISYAGKAPKSFALTDAGGKPAPCQVTGLAAKGGKVTGTLWTVVTLPPGGTATLSLQPGTPAPTALRLVPQGKEYVLSNERCALRLPNLTEKLPQPVDLASLPAPLLAVGGADGKPSLGQGAWVAAEQPLQVKAAATTMVENGLVRVTVRYRLTFTDDRFYQADITLGARQDAALFTDDTDVEAPKAIFRFSFQPGLRADRVFWRNNYYADVYKGLAEEPITFDKEKVICSICPWTFWWLQDRTIWAGFYRDDAEPFIGIIALKPSHWTPTDWDGYDRTVIPITARPGGQVDISLGLLAWTKKKPDGATQFKPAHRELAITVGNAADYIDRKKMDSLKEANAARQRNDSAAWNRLLGEGLWQFKLRSQLLQYSEFPLDEVKDFGFDFKPKTADRKHPYLLFTPADIARARRQAKFVPSEKAALEKDTRYMSGLGCDPVVKINSGPDGWQKFYREHYVANWLYDCAPRAYIGSDDPKYGLILSSGVKGLAYSVMDQFLNAPGCASIGQNAHLGTTAIFQLLLKYDALADTEYLTPEDKAYIQAVLVFGAYVTDHADYWNTDLGLCSANPNMTSLMKLPLGLLALYLDGHPKSDQWLKYAEAELQREINGDWIAPGGAWLECPMYQSVSLDGMFMLAQALKNVRGKDYFTEPNFKATMDYYGFILTPPDRRFPPDNTNDGKGYMTIPSIGDAFPGFATAFSGWMARATAKSDPAFSARQQFYWLGQGCSIINGGRAGSFAMALCDPELPAAPPTEMARAFPGFGNILRTSWTDAKASYVSQRCGNFLHHFDPGDYNSIQYFAKGAPLCIDFGHRGATNDEVVRMWQPDYHSTVSYDVTSSAKHWGKSGGPVDQNRQAQEVRSLLKTLDYSAGAAWGSGGQNDTRHLLLVKSDDPLGATYLVIRDTTRDGQPNQEFFWNLWCMAKEPEIAGNVAHFPGVYDVDLDAHVLSPANPQFVKDSFGYEEWVYPWGKFSEAQTGVHVRKAGSTEDFFTVLYPRAAGQGPAQVTALENGRAVSVTHMEGADVVLLSPGKPVMVAAGEVQLTGEIAFARRYANGTLRLAVIKNAGAAQAGWGVKSDGPVSLQIKDTTVTGESSGDAHTAQIILPANYGATTVTLDGKPLTAKREGNALTIELPGGYHGFSITGK